MILSRVATPCFDCLTKMSPVVKVSSKPLKNWSWSWYLGVCVVAVKSQGCYPLFQWSHKNKPYCEGFKTSRNMWCPLRVISPHCTHSPVPISRNTGLHASLTLILTECHVEPISRNPGSACKSNTYINRMPCWYFFSLLPALSFGNVNIYILSFNGTENLSGTIHSRNGNRNPKGTDIKRFKSRCVVKF